VDVLAVEGLVHAAHRAELAAHGTGVVVLGGAVGPDGLGRLGVEGAGPLGLPVQGAAGVAHPVVDLPGPAHPLGDVGGVGGDAAGDDALLDVLQVGQSQMLGGGDVAQDSCAVHGGDGPANGRGDVVGAGGDVGGQGAQRIEGRALADRLLHLHTGGDLVAGDMAGAFHQDLHVLFPGAAGQFAQPDQLVDLADVGGVGQAAGPA